MYSWTEDFGKFWTEDTDWKSKKKIHIVTKDDMTGEDMVIMAIKIAKKYNCTIIGRVEYTPNESTSGTVSFMVECDTKTYRYFYDGGKLSKPHSTQIKEKDILAYEEKFGSRKCADDHIGKNRYYFKDNWDGRILYFPSLKEAKEAAMTQTGNSCCIYEVQPYGRGSKIVCFASASGNCPP